MRGGYRPGAGRKKGSRNKRTLALEAAVRAAAVGLPEGSTALALLQAIYRDETLDLLIRMAAATHALPYEQPKLASVHHTAQVRPPMRKIEMVFVAPRQHAET